MTPRLCYAYITARCAAMQAQKEIRLLSSMLTAAVRWPLIDSNPLIGQMKFEKSDDKEQRYVTDDEFIDAALVGNYWLWCYMVLKLATGLRQKDIRGLQVDNIKMDGLHVVISKSKKKAKKLRIFSLPTTLRRHSSCTWPDAPRAPSSSLNEATASASPASRAHGCA